MRVIFLDLDGVVGTGKGHIDPVKVARVNKIAKATGAVVVFSTAWRQVYPLRTLTGIFQRYGLKPEVIDATPRDLGAGLKDRWIEIEAWLQFHPEVTGYVILDDIEDFGPLAHRHVMTGPVQRGLQDEDIPLAIEALMRRRMR